MYSKGLIKTNTLIGIEKVDINKPITIVEGILDALHAKAVGIENVVALGGSGMNIRQIELIQDLGVKEINLCLDNDTTGKEATRRIALQIKDREYDISVNKIEMPKNIKDLDQLITEKGRDMAKEMIMNGAKSISYHELSEERDMKHLSKFSKEYDDYEYELVPGPRGMR